ncbi:MAG: NUDIX hydrolase [Promethearchaeota archaeon]
MYVEPKIAATVVLLRERISNLEYDDDCKFEVFMGKRHENARFLSEHHVFPGGRIEAQDMFQESRARVIGFDKEILDNIRDVCEEPSDLWVIAIRELFEETGILIAMREKGCLFEINGKNLKRFKKYQENLQNDRETMTGILIKENLYYATNYLKYFGRLITPKESPIRFDTQFFLCKFPQNQNLNLFRDELTEGSWCTPRHFIELYQKKEIKIIFPQYATLNRLKRFKTIQDAFSNSKTGFEMAQVKGFR